MVEKANKCASVQITHMYTCKSDNTHSDTHTAQVYIMYMYHTTYIIQKKNSNSKLIKKASQQVGKTNAAKITHIDVIF